MSKTIGPYRLNPRGDYNPAADPLYSLLDLVSDGGGSYVYINDTPSNEPTSSTSHWQQIATMGGQDLVDAAVAARDAAKGHKDAAAGYAAQLAAGLLRPKGTYADLAALNAGTPTVADTDEIYITLDDGKWCYHNGTAWVAGGQFQATERPLDTTLSVSGMAADAKVTGDKVSELKSALNATTDRTGVDYQPPVSFTDGIGVKYINGQLQTTSDRSYSDYIPINGYEKVVVTMGKYTGATIYGIAFYTAATSSSYISGVRETYNASIVGAEERTFDIPSTANYMRVSWFPSSSEYYSQFSCHLVKDGTLDAELAEIKNVVTENVLNPNEITVGKFINNSGTMGSSDSYCVTGYIAVKKNDQVVLAYSDFTTGQIMRYVTAYNSSKSAVSASGAENVTSYTVPEGIAFIRVSADIRVLDTRYPRISLNGVAIKYQTYYGGLTSGLAKEDHTNLDLFRFYPLSALPEYFVNNLAYKPLGPLSKGYICLVSDDGDPGLATYTVPMLIAKNVPGTFAVMSASGCWEDNTNKATILDAVENHGCVIAQHGGSTWDQYDELTLNQFFDREKEFWDSLGVTPYGAVCPAHIINNMIRAVAGGRFGCLRAGYDYGLHYENYTNGARSNLYGLSSQNSIDGSLQSQCSVLDYCKANNKLRIIHWHENSMSAADKTQLEGIIDYAKSISLTFVTMKDIPDII